MYPFSLDEKLEPAYFVVDPDFFLFRLFNFFLYFLISGGAPVITVAGSGKTSNAGKKLFFVL